MNFTLEVFEKGKEVSRIETHTQRVLYGEIRSLNWRNCPSVYLRVSYGMKKDHRGKLLTFYNDGLYDTKKDFYHAYHAFLEL